MPPKTQPSTHLDDDECDGTLYLSPEDHARTQRAYNDWVSRAVAKIAALPASAGIDTQHTWIQITPKETHNATESPTVESDRE